MFKGHTIGRKTCAVGIMDREVSEIKGTLKQGSVYCFAGRQWAYCTGSEERVSRVEERASDFEE